MERAVIYDLTGRETLAEPLYREILKRAPDQAASHNNLGLNQLVQGRYSEAAVSFHKALELDPTRARIRNNLATAYVMLGDEASALDLFTETIGKAGAYNNLGYLYMTQGRLEDAERTLRMALELNPRFYKRAQENLDRVERMKSARHTP
jgi:Flp pilus assembly protein TadD